MKKILMAFGLAASLVLASAVSAFAATNLNTTTKSYEPTYGTNQNPTFTGTSADTLYGSTNNAPANFNEPSNGPVGNLPSGAPSLVPDSGSTTDQTLVTRIHSNYASNTNACAACHATHTGVGESLLQWDGETETCMACHDGTAGIDTYNVADGTIGTTSAITNGGVFPTSNAVDANGDPVNSKSMHDVFGGVQITAAPGGNFTATGASTAADQGNFKEDFTCVSCHSPHGNGANFRILDPNVNGFADLHTYNATNKISWDTVAAPGGTAGQYVAKVAFKDVNSTAPFYAYLLTGPYPYGITVTDGTPVWDATNKKWSNAVAATKYSFDNSKGYTVVTVDSSVASPNVIGYVAAKVKGTVENPLQASEKVTYINGFSEFCGACHTDYNTSYYTAKSTTDGYGNRTFIPGTFKQATDRDNGGAAMWQDAAQTLPVYTPSHAVSIETGVFTQAYRHTVGLNAGADGHGNAANGMPFEQRKYYENGVLGGTQNYLSCLSCHVAHGTDNAYWQAYATQRGEWGVPVAAKGTSLSTDAQAIYSASEVFDTTNASTTDAGNGNVINSRGSNLKRMPNMATCEGCHEKGLNNQGVNATYNN